MDKPKEFWVRNSEMNGVQYAWSYKPGCFADCIKVIEKSAYDKLEKDFEDAIRPAPSGSVCYGCKQREDWNASLKQQADKLAETLRIAQFNMRLDNKMQDADWMDLIDQSLREYRGEK